MEEVAREKFEVEETNVLKQSNISLVLNSYSDIFSSFDPRPYSERALSDDFLVECKNASRDKKNQIELRLLIEKDKRNAGDESKIKKRLKEHFKHHETIVNKEMKSVVKRGVLFVFIGMLFMILTTTLNTFFETNFLISLMTIIFEPGGWFFFWEGLAQIIFDARTMKPEHSFYKKMTNAQIIFLSY